MRKIAATPFEASSLSRVWQHTQNRNIGVLTAFRAGFDAQANQQRNSELAADIRAAHFGYIKIKGRYIENHGTPNAKPVDEDSFMVIGLDKDDSGNLLGFLKREGQKFDQDSVLYKPFGDPNAYLIGTNNSEFPGFGKSHKLGPWHPNRMGEFHSVLFPGKTFTFESAARLTARSYQSIAFTTQATFSSWGRENPF